MPEQTKYTTLTRIEQPLEVWTPSGSYRISHIDPNSTPASTTLPQIIIEARNRQPRQRPITSGEWHRIRGVSGENKPQNSEWHDYRTL